MMDSQKRIGFFVSKELHKKMRLLALSKDISPKELIMRALKNSYKELETICER